MYELEKELEHYGMYRGYELFVESRDNIYYGSVYMNSTCFHDNIKSNSPIGCLTKCKAWVDSDIEEGE